jgi:polyphosphate glucokinase
MHILAIDIGGTGIKATILDETGQMLTEPVRVPTPKPCGPQTFLDIVARLTHDLPAFECVAVGFPGVVRYGKTWTAPLLGNNLWHGFDLASALERQWSAPILWSTYSLGL